MSIAELCQPISLFLSDVDGVMTDGGLTYHAGGSESKRFHIRDGLGIRLWQRAGFQFGIVTGRASEMVTRRAAELEIGIVRQGRDDKWPQVAAIAAELGITAEEICYLGDDLLDLSAIRGVGLGVAVADAVPEVCAAADWVAVTPGGGGVVREVVEFLLKSKGLWDESIASCLV